MRQITMYKFEIGTSEMVEVSEDTYKRVKHPIIEGELASSMTKTEARKALADAGHPLKRGADVYWQKVGAVKLYFETADLLSIVKKAEDVPID